MVAPVVLILTVVLSFAAALGVSSFAFQHLFHFQGATPTCGVADLYLAIGSPQGGAGSVFYPIEFTNTSTHTCALRGYPR